MKKEKLEIIITGILIISLIILSMSLLKKRQKKPPIKKVKEETPKVEISKEDSIKPMEELEWGRDPFVVSYRKSQSKGIALPVLTAIIWDEKHPMAVLNDEVTGIGVVIEGYRVIKIERDKVVLQKDDNQFTLELYMEE